MTAIVGPRGTLVSTTPQGRPANLTTNRPGSLAGTERRRLVDWQRTRALLLAGALDHQADTLRDVLARRQLSPRALTLALAGLIGYARCRRILTGQTEPRIREAMVLARKLRLPLDRFAAAWLASAMLRQAAQAGTIAPLAPLPGRSPRPG